MRNNYILFSFLVFLNFILGYLSKELLNSDELLLNFLGENFSKEQLNGFISTQNKIERLSYLFIPLFLFLKITIISFTLEVGIFFFDKKIKFKKLFNIVVKAEFIFLLVIISKTVWFYYFQSNYTIQDLQHFHPLSALNIVGYQGLETWFIYPFQVINIFELVYWLLLGHMISKDINSNLDKAMTIVASSYGLGLLIWVVVVMFYNLNMS
ncbi:MAG: hypothetical protein GKR88_09930 [Flavobacteriaceae bacterium]|nr:MAG: hypothetical protein GKR88_09930 [Flavobacteriaceae bacterium]